jgi:CRISPR-associated protein Csh2
MAHFNNRVFGCVIVKSINSNYNADFSGQPRTLPNGTVYATDKALKYAIKNYIKDIKGEKSLLYFKRLNAEFNPFDLPSAYKDIFNTEVKSDDKKAILKNILGKIDHPYAKVGHDVLRTMGYGKSGGGASGGSGLASRLTN